MTSQGEPVWHPWARELRKSMNRAKVAEQLGMCETSVEYATNEVYRERARTRAREYQRKRRAEMRSEGRLEG